MEFEQVVDGAEHCPLGPDITKPATEELAKATCRFDLAEDRLDGLFAFLVALFAFGGHQAAAHLVAVRPVVRGALGGRVGIGRFVVVVAA